MTEVGIGKVPVLNSNEFDLWKLRIKQHILLSDYTVWDVIINGNKRPTTNGADGEPGMAARVPVSDLERREKQTEIKALSILLIAIPNEYQSQFEEYEDAKSLWEALEKRFSGTKNTKKNKKALLKQEYENFNSLPGERMTQTFDRYKKLTGEMISAGIKYEKDDFNRKFIRALGKEWIVYTVSYRQGDTLESLELDDLYNDLRVFESEVETEKVVNNNPSITNSNTALATTSGGPKHEINEEISFESFICKCSNLTSEEVKQMHQDDSEEIDLKWQSAMLALRARRFLNRTGRRFNPRNNERITFDKSKVKCYECSELGHFARDCPNKSKTNNPRTTQDTTQSALMSQDIFGFDWSDLAEETSQNRALISEEHNHVETTVHHACIAVVMDDTDILGNLVATDDLVSTELTYTDIGIPEIGNNILGYDWNDDDQGAPQEDALMAIASTPTSSSHKAEVNSNLCTPECKAIIVKYKDHNQLMSDSLRDLEQQRRSAHRVIDNLENQIKSHKINEQSYQEKINLLEWQKEDLLLKLKVARDNIKQLEQKHDKVELDVGKLEFASKSVNDLCQKQIHGKVKAGLGYKEVAPPFNQNYIPPSLDEPRIPISQTPPKEAFNVDPINYDEVLIEDLVEESQLNIVKNENIPIENHLITIEGCTQQSSQSLVSMPCPAPINKNKSPTLGKPKTVPKETSKTWKHIGKRGNQRNMNQVKTQKGQHVKSSRNGCFICGKLNHYAKICYHNPQNQKQVIQKPHNGEGYKGRAVYKNNFVKHVSSENQSVNKRNITSNKRNRVNTARQTGVSTAKGNTAKNKGINTARINTVKTNRMNPTHVNTAKHHHVIKALINNKKHRHVKPVSTPIVKSKVVNTKIVQQEKSFKQVWQPKIKVTQPPTPIDFSKLVQRKVSYFDEMGKPKSALAWVPTRN